MKKRIFERVIPERLRYKTERKEVKKYLKLLT
jgi:hypothetical protein